jgi:hypothetical protein
MTEDPMPSTCAGLMALLDKGNTENERLLAGIDRPGGTLDRIAIIVGQKDWRDRPRKRPGRLAGVTGGSATVLAFPMRDES